MSEHYSDPGKRRAQHLLASEVLEMVHGREEAEKTQADHQMMRKPSLASLTSQSTINVGEAASGQDVNRIVLSKALALNSSIGHVLFNAGLAKSKSEAVRMVEKGGVYVASTDGSAELTFTKISNSAAGEVSNLLVDNLLILRLGKWKVRIIEIVDDEQQNAVSTNPAR